MEDGLILGDSGFALSRYSMTPYTNLIIQEERFKAANKTTWCSIQRSIGQLKCRFVCIVVLHNIAKHLNEEDFEDDNDNYICDETENDFNPHGNEAGTLLRQHLTMTTFS